MRGKMALFPRQIGFAFAMFVWASRDLAFDG